MPHIDALQAPFPMHAQPSLWNFRQVLICFVALSVSFPIAWISIAKVFLFIFGLAYLVANHLSNQRDSVLSNYWTPRVVLTGTVAFFISLMWTSVDMNIALLTLVKHAKLVEILLLISLIRTVREARIAIAAFTAGQAFLLASSWLLALGIPLPWVTDPIGKYVVFSTYLDQSIMFATAAAVFWHLRSDYLKPSWLSGSFAIAAIINVLLLLDGRTGYAVALTVLSLSVMWAMPKRMRLITLIVTPIVVLAGLSLGSSHVQGRISKILDESQSYSKQVETDSSSGWRLNAWHRSIQAIAENPWYGHGVGSWAITVKRLQGDSAIKTFGSGNASNPHQEYLLWGVELGLGGIFLFSALLLACLRDAREFPASVKRALYSVIAAMAVACLFNSAVYDDLMGDFLCITVGLLMALGIRSKRDPLNNTPTVPVLHQTLGAT